MKLPMRAPLAGALLLPLGLLSGGCEMMIAGPRAQASDRWEKTYEVSPGATLEIENTNGPIDVRTHAEPTIQVTAHRTARAVSEQGARDLLARTKLEENATADLVRLVTPRNQGPSMGQHIEVRYEVLVPATAPVTLTTVNGKIELDGRDRRGLPRDRQRRDRGPWCDRPPHGRDRQRQRLARPDWPSGSRRTHRDRERRRHVEDARGCRRERLCPDGQRGHHRGRLRERPGGRAPASTLRGHPQRWRPDASRGNGERRRVDQRPGDGGHDRGARRSDPVVGSAAPIRTLATASYRATPSPTRLAFRNRS